MRIVLALIASLQAIPGDAFAHGGHESSAPTIASVGALSVGAREALACDGEIQDTVFEYDLCLNARREAIEGDAEARVGFWLVATLRVHGAANNGYADAGPYLARYRETLARMQAVRPVSIAELCRQLTLECPSLLGL